MTAVCYVDLCLMIFILVGSKMEDAEASCERAPLTSLVFRPFANVLTRFKPQQSRSKTHIAVVPAHPDWPHTDVDRKPNTDGINVSLVFRHITSPFQEVNFRNIQDLQARISALPYQTTSRVL